MSVKSRCVSVVELPCPGKCFSVEIMFSSWFVLMISLRLLITVSGSDEKLLPNLPITGLSGLVFKSATGARFILICMAFSVRSVCDAAAVVLSGLLSLPRCSAETLGGNPLAGLSRLTLPPSWSMAINSGIFDSPCNFSVRLESCCGLVMFLKGVWDGTS